MQFLKEGYLRVTSPLTIDGVRPKYDQRGQMMYKETELPLTAKKYMDEQNRKLPDHLKKKIEVIKADQVPGDPSGTKEAGTVEPEANTNPSTGKKRFNQVNASQLKRW